jgi:hypothetical protein
MEMEQYRIKYSVRGIADNLAYRVHECIFSFVFVGITLIVVSVVFVLNSLRFFFLNIFF